MTSNPCSGDLMSKRAALAAGAVIVAVGAAGCGASSSAGGGQASTPSKTSAPEVNPAGDIPDNQAYVAYAPPGGGFSVKVPEGWSRVATGGAVTFTDKLNAVRVESMAAQRPPSVRDARQTELPRLAATVKGFKAG